MPTVAADCVESSHVTDTSPRVIVTGAGGYIGRRVVTALCRLGASPVAVTRPGSSTRFPRNVESLEVDLLGDPRSAELLLVANADVAIHLAWEDGFVHNSPRHIDSLPAHLHLLERLADGGVRRIAVLGTMHEVGYWEGAIDESTPTRPRTLYGIAKNALRGALDIQLEGRAELAWLRCFYITGDDASSHSVFTKLLEAEAAGRDSFPLTSGSAAYDFIDVDVLAEQIAVTALAPGETGIINCASGVAIPLRDRIEQFARDERLRIRLDFGTFPDREYDSPAVWADTTRIERIMRRARLEGHLGGAEPEGADTPA